MKTFQERVEGWMGKTFGLAVSLDTRERNMRFLEEALELVQACDMTAAEVLSVVGYVYSRKVGEKSQEVGGVMVTLSALCSAHDIDMTQAAADEFVRIDTPDMSEKIRAKQLTKPNTVRGL